jgi:hypothetical protein
VGLCQALARGAMADECGGAAARLALADEAAIKAQLVGGQHAHAQHGGLAIDCNPAGADPVFSLATRRQARARQDFLKPLTFGVSIMPGTSTGAMGAIGAWSGIARVRAVATH